MNSERVCLIALMLTFVIGDLQKLKRGRVARYSVKTVETTGAGDSIVSAFLVSLHKTWI